MNDELDPPADHMTATLGAPVPGVYHALVDPGCADLRLATYVVYTGVPCFP